MPRVTGFKMRGGDQDRMKEACSGDKDEWIINHMGSVLNGLEMFHYSHQCRRHYRRDLRKSYALLQDVAVHYHSTIAIIEDY